MGVPGKREIWGGEHRQRIEVLLGERRSLGEIEKVEADLEEPTSVGLVGRVATMSRRRSE